MRRAAALALLVLGACDDKHAPTVPSEPHWTTRPIQKAIGQTRGTRYAIDLPVGMSIKDRDKQGMRHTLPGIAITLSIGGIEHSLADYKDTHSDDKFLREDSLPDGFSVTLQSPTYTDPRYVTVHQYRTFGLVTTSGHEGMTCHIELSPVPGGEATRTYVPVAEKLCASLQMLADE